MSYFQYKPTNILIPSLVKKKVIKGTFRSFELSELQAHLIHDSLNLRILKSFKNNILILAQNWFETVYISRNFD